jgi:hypothetical protein
LSTNGHAGFPVSSSNVSYFKKDTDLSKLFPVGREQLMQSDNDLVNNKIVKQWLMWGFSGGLSPRRWDSALAQIQLSGFLSNEYFISATAASVHTNGVIFGVFSTIFLGLVNYMVPN